MEMSVLNVSESEKNLSRGTHEKHENASQSLLSPEWLSCLQITHMVATPCGKCLVCACVLNVLVSPEAGTGSTLNGAAGSSRKQEKRVKLDQVSALTQTSSPFINQLLIIDLTGSPK